MKTFLAGLSKYLTLMMAGALAGGAVVAWFGPGVAAWWASPGGAPKSFSCETDVMAATTGLVKCQAIGAVLAAVVVAIGGALVSAALSRRAARRVPLAQAAAPDSAGTPAQPEAGEP